MRIHFTQDTKVWHAQIQTDDSHLVTPSIPMITPNVRQNVLSLVGHVYAYKMRLHRFVYVSQCCTQHTASSV